MIVALPDNAKGSTTSRRSIYSLVVMLVLATLLVAAAAISASVGAANISLSRVVSALFSHGAGSVAETRDQLILLSIRLPRVVLASLVGALLAAAGTVMQGLFRNPLADPGLVGVSAGAGLAAASIIVAGDKFLPNAVTNSPFLLPVAAFLGALVTTSLLYRIATWRSRTSIATMLLAGLALGALASAGTGLLVFLADDRQLRDITFWMLGSIAGATWPKILAIAPFLVFVLICSAFIGRGLRSPGAWRSRSLSHGNRGRKTETASDRHGRVRGGCRGLCLRRHRLRRHHRSASAPPRHWPGSPPAAARFGLLWRNPPALR